MPLQKLLLLLAICGLAAACKSPGSYRRQADEVAYKIVEQAQDRALNKSEPFTIERPQDILRRRLLEEQGLPLADPAASLGTKALEPLPKWPRDNYLDEKDPEGLADDRPVTDSLHVTLVDALQIGAHNSRDYQTRKEQVYVAALDLDLEWNTFRPIFAASGTSTMSWDLNGDQNTVKGWENTAAFSVSQNLMNGARITTRLGVDVARLLSQEKGASRGLFGDATVTVPLMRGSGKHIVREPLTQAERNVVYAIHDFERFKHTFAVQVASSYLQVLRQQNEVDNAEDNYRSLVLSGRRARRLADAGRLPEIQVDQAMQDELRARDRWIAAQQALESRLDGLKVLIGLPTDARIELDRGEFQRLAAEMDSVLQATAEGEVTVAGAQDSLAADAAVELVPPSRDGAGPWELEPEEAIRIALENRLDLRNSIGRVFDAQRRVIVAADLLRADVTLGGSGTVGARRSLGSSGADDSNIRFDEGRYSTFLTVDLPLERTRERNVYRESLISLERVVRDLQNLEDSIKADVRANLRTLLESRESLRIQVQSVRLAERRVSSTDLFLQAGRAQIRDVLEAQEALVSAQNALTAAVVNYRIAELQLQRDLGLLEVDENGLWKESRPTGEDL